MIEGGMTVHITEADLVRDIHAVLAKVQEGVEVIVEQDHRPVAVIKTPQGTGRLLSESIALAEGRGSKATLDEGFMKDVEEGIARRSQPWNPPTWE
jgi:antitoxin (DNA-binding transcriptional repressor) of toxin-antitoxin stability system